MRRSRVGTVPENKCLRGVCGEELMRTEEGGGDGRKEGEVGEGRG